MVNKIMKKSKVVQYLAKFVQDIPVSAWEKFRNNSNGVAALAGSSNKEVLDYMVKNGLTKPDNLAKFMVQVQIEQMTALYEGIYSIKRDNKNEWKAMLESAESKFKFALDNPSKRDAELDVARRQVMDCISVFKNEAIEHIYQIRSIDNQSNSKFFFSSWASLIKCNNESSFAIETTKRLLEAYKLLFIISAHAQDNISSLYESYKNCKKDIIAGDNCLLMADYCKHESDKEFWYSLSDTWDKNEDFFEESVEIFSKEEDDKDSFWDDDANIDIFN